MRKQYRAGLKRGTQVARSFCLAMPCCCLAKLVHFLAHLCTQWPRYDTYSYFGSVVSELISVKKNPFSCISISHLKFPASSNVEDGNLLWQLSSDDQINDLLANPVLHRALLLDLPLVPLDLPRDCIDDSPRASLVPDPVEAVTTV